MNQFLIGIILILSLGGYYLYSQNQILQANNAQLEGAVATQEEAIASLQSDFALQTTQLQEMTVKSQAAQRELNRYSEFIRNYELSAKIMGDPVENLDHAQDTHDAEEAQHADDRRREGHALRAAHIRHDDLKRRHADEDKVELVPVVAKVDGQRLADPLDEHLDNVGDEED